MKNEMKSSIVMLKSIIHVRLKREFFSFFYAPNHHINVIKPIEAVVYMHGKKYDERERFHLVIDMFRIKSIIVNR